jgi:hypothetical protein
MFRVPEIQYKCICPETLYPKICDDIPQSLQTNKYRHGISMGHRRLYPLHFLLISHSPFDAVNLNETFQNLNLLMKAISR